MYIGAVSTRKRLAVRPLLRLIGNQVPTVDVLIPCCGESLDIILDTVRAACALDYPRDRYRVILLDDGKSADLEKQIAILKNAHGNLFYSARGVDVTIHSKGANLNHGLRFMQNLGPSEYVAVLDVDMIPMPDFLRALLPQLLDKPSFAMAISPQYFYNIPDGDPLSQGLNFTFDIGLLMKDISDSSPCHGTGFVLRRSAVELIGGIPTDSISDSMMTSIVIWEKNWKIAYVWEPLQWGLVPEGYAGHVKQATRWTQGLISIVSILLSGSPRLRNLNLSTRIRMSLDALVFIGPIFALAFAMLFIPAVLISRRSFVASSPKQLQHLLFLSALQLLANWTIGLMAAEGAGFRSPIWPPYRHPFLAPFQLMGILESLSPIKLKRNFTTAGSTLHGRRERESRASNSFIRRIVFVLGDFGSWFQLFVIASTIFGATHSIRTTLSLKHVDSQHQLQILLTGVAWPPAFVHWTLFIVECWRPLSYVIFPPKIPTRETLLNRDPDTKVAYPSEMAKDEKRVRPSQRFSIVVLAYAVFILACSWGIQFQ